jgi:hypothetical protein
MTRRNMGDLGRCQDNGQLKCILNKQGQRMWTEFVWINRERPTACCCQQGNEHTGSKKKRQGIWPAERQPVSQKELCSVLLVKCLTLAAVTGATACSWSPNTIRKHFHPHKTQCLLPMRSRYHLSQPVSHFPRVSSEKLCSYFLLLRSELCV